MADTKNYKPIAPIVRTFEVLKAEYPPIGNIQFTPAQTTYDGKEHSLEIAAPLPAGVTVSYEYYKDGVRIDDADGNPVQSVVDAGRYTVKAVFSHTNINLKEIPSISSVLHIERAKINVFELGIEYSQTWVYDGTPKAVVTTRNPEYIKISYEYYLNGVLVKNADGTPATAVTEVGEYMVRVIVEATNENYVPMESIIMTFSIVSPIS
jgi:hypothetical protein